MSEHTHPHPHPHTHAHAPLPAPSRVGSVVLDIGADTGALVIHTGPEQDGVEIEVSPVADPGHRTHAAVRPRHLPDRTVYSVVITPLAAGDYTIWRDQDTAEAAISITGGSVSEYHWT